MLSESTPAERSRYLKVHAARKPSVPYWVIANRLDVSENTIGRWMRSPTPEQAAQILNAIDVAREDMRKGLVG